MVWDNKSAQAWSADSEKCTPYVACCVIGPTRIKEYSLEATHATRDFRANYHFNVASDIVNGDLLLTSAYVSVVGVEGS